MKRLRDIFERDYCSNCRRETQQRHTELADGRRICECLACTDIEIIEPDELLRSSSDHLRQVLP